MCRTPSLSRCEVRGNTRFSESPFLVGSPVHARALGQAVDVVDVSTAPAGAVGIVGGVPHAPFRLAGEGIDRNAAEEADLPADSRIPAPLAEFRGSTLNE